MAKLGLALSGGGIKGVAHIGALKAFEENKIDFDVITGTSSGSIVATLYAVGYSSNEIIDIFRKFAKKIKYVDYKNIFKLIFGILTQGKIIIKGFSSNKIIEKLVNEYCKKKNIYNISDINIPFGIPSVDLYTNTVQAFVSTNVLFHKTPDIHYINDIHIGTAVKASSAYPGIFAPVSFQDSELIDGGLKENTPWKLAKDLGADKVVNIIFETPYQPCKCINMVHVIESSINILSREASLCDLEGADCLIKIMVDPKIGLLDTEYLEELYQLGYESTYRKMREIKSLLKIN